MGVLPVIIHFNRIFHYKPSSYWGTTMIMETPIYQHFSVVNIGIPSISLVTDVGILNVAQHVGVLK